jgi:hypothetical protein
MAAEQDFVIALRAVNIRGLPLNSYFGKIRGRCHAGDRLARHEGLIEVVLNEETYPNVSHTQLFNKLSALGMQCEFRSEAHFRQVLEEVANDELH